MVTDTKIVKNNFILFLKLRKSFSSFFLAGCHGNHGAKSPYINRKAKNSLHIIYMLSFNKSVRFNLIFYFARPLLLEKKLVLTHAI